MSELPKRPTKEQAPTISYTDLNGNAWTPQACYENSHAVAVRAVEALRELTNYTSGDDMHEAATEALSAIDASGWEA